MEMPARKTDNKYTYREYLLWADDERWELINGIPYNMSPAPSTEHQRISTELLGQFWSYLKDRSCQVFAAPFDVRLPRDNEEDEDIDTVVQPDLVIVCDKGKLDNRGLKGAPALVIEIISPSTAKKDLQEKFLLYEQNGVKEYWIVLPGEKAVDIYQLDEAGKYVRSGLYLYPEKVKVGILEDLEIDLGLVFGE